MGDSEAQTRLKATGRNDLCPCGSGKKYKKCHMASDEADAHAVALTEAQAVQESEAPATAGGARAKKAPSPERTGGRSKEAAAAKPSRDTRPKNLPRRGAV